MITLKKPREDLARTLRENPSWFACTGAGGVVHVGTAGEISEQDGVANVVMSTLEAASVYAPMQDCFDSIPLTERLKRAAEENKKAGGKGKI